MIKSIKVCSKKDFTSLVRGLHILDSYNPDLPIKAYGQKYIFISIADPWNTPDSDKEKDYANGKDSHLLPEGRCVLNLDFGDYSFVDGESPEKDCMTLEDAIKITNFIHRFILFDEDEYKLVIHCSAGVSRSFTIGEFVQDIVFYHTTEKPLLKTNSVGYRNSYIRKLLEDAVFGPETYKYF